MSFSTRTSDQIFDAAVLGSGIAGMGTAKALADLGLRVIVLEKDMRGAASIRAAGILDPFLEISGMQQTLARLNLSAFSQFDQGRGITNSSQEHRATLNARLPCQLIKVLLLGGFQVRTHLS